jgi:hypothetical protein
MPGFGVAASATPAARVTVAAAAVIAILRVLLIVRSSSARPRRRHIRTSRTLADRRVPHAHTLVDWQATHAYLQMPSQYDGACDSRSSRAARGPMRRL